MGRLAAFSLPFAVFVLALGLLPRGTAAAPPAQLWQAPEDGATGTGAGQMESPQGIAASSVSGEVYVADAGNHRVNVFSPWGEFLMAFGWGVRDGTPERQSCGPAASPPSGSCEKGIEGTGPGQFLNLKAGLAVDSIGDLYVFETDPFTPNFRVQKLDPEGDFLRMWGGGVITGGAAGSGDLSAGSTAVTSVTATSKSFEAGQTISGAGIPPETRVLDVGVGTLTLSKAATASAAGVALSVAEGAGNVPTDERQRIELQGSPSGGSFVLIHTSATTSAAVAKGSDQASATGRTRGTLHVGDATNVRTAVGKGDLGAGSATVSNLTTSQGAFTLGAPISGGGIPAGATIAALGPGTLTLSAPATESAGGRALTAHAKVAAIDAATGSFTLSADSLDAFSASATDSTGQITATESTAAVPYDASAAQVREALEALPDIGAGNVAVSAAAAGPWAVELTGPRLGDTDVRTLSADAGGLLPTGTVSITIAVQGAGAAEICTAAQVADCRAGLPAGEEADEASFRPTFIGGTKIAIGPGGDVFAGDVGRIQRFGPNGEHKEAIEGEALVGKAVQSLAMDSAGNFYLGFPKDILGNDAEDGVRKLSPTGALLQSFDVENPKALALDETGDLYAAENPEGVGYGREQRIAKRAPDGGRLIPSLEELEQFERELEEFEAEPEKKPPPEPLFGEAGAFLSPPASILGLATSSACGIEGHDLYASNFDFNESESYVAAYGPPPDPDLCPPPPAAPTIADQFAISATSEAAVVRAKINPHFWPDTSFYVEYGPGKCSEGGCPAKLPAAPDEEALGEEVVRRAIATKGIFLGGLSPNTTYHFRFVARSSGGGPTVGVGEGEAEGTFTTQPLPVSEADGCPNAALRNGPAAALPDCRAYEMVSPVDKEGADVFALGNINSNVAGFDKSAASGNGLTYSAYRAFGDAQSAPFTSQYLARRTAGGWSNHGISPPRGINILGSGFTLETEFRYFSEDLCTGWLMHDTDPVLAAGAIAGFANLYSADLCASPTKYAAITTEPPTVEPVHFIPELQGVSGDGTSAVFRVADKLTANAAAGKLQVYVKKGSGTLRLVCVLPNGASSGQSCSAGTANDALSVDGRRNLLAGALSEDGSRVFWTSNASGQFGPGAIYVRVNPELAQSPVEGGKCTRTDRACTYPLSAAASPEPAQYWAADPQGSRALFAVAGKGPEKGDLYEAALAEDGEGFVEVQVNLIAHRVVGLLGASADLSRIYLLSEEALAGAAVAGEPNIYLYEAGAFRFVAELSSADAASDPGAGLSAAAAEPYQHAAQVSADGLSAAFMSSASPTGFNNSDASSGEADAEVYLYRAAAGGGAGQLSCVSCNPSGVRPAGRNIAGASQYWVAAQIPTANSQLYAPRVLSAGGGRLFFESFEGLAARDRNGKQDVYQWEAPGEGSCSTASPAYSPPNDGCLALISSGQSTQDSAILDASPDGADVFFATGQSLLAQDPGLIDIYDARVQGGLPPPEPPTPPCQGEACQGPAAAPDDPTPASAGFRGPGDLVPRPARKVRRCSRGKRRVRRAGRVRCAKRTRDRVRHRRGGKDRRAGR